MLRQYLKNESQERNASALLKLGEALLNLGEFDQSLTVLEECIEFHAEDPAAYQARLAAARAYVDGGRPFMHILRMVSVPSKTEGKQTVYYVSIIGFNCSAKQLKAMMDPVAARFGLLKASTDAPAPK